MRCDFAASAFIFESAFSLSRPKPTQAHMHQTRRLPFVCKFTGQNLVRLLVCVSCGASFCLLRLLRRRYGSRDHIMESACGMLALLGPEGGDRCVLPLPLGSSRLHDCASKGSPRNGLNAYFFYNRVCGEKNRIVSCEASVCPCTLRWGEH